MTRIIINRRRSNLSLTNYTRIFNNFLLYNTSALYKYQAQDLEHFWSHKYIKMCLFWNMCDLYRLSASDNSQLVDMTNL